MGISYEQLVSTKINIPQRSAWVLSGRRTGRTACCLQLDKFKDRSQPSSSTAKALLELEVGASFSSGCGNSSKGWLNMAMFRSILWPENGDAPWTPTRFFPSGECGDIKFEAPTKTLELAMLPAPAP